MVGGVPANGRRVSSTIQISSKDQRGASSSLGFRLLGTRLVPGAMSHRLDPLEDTRIGSSQFRLGNRRNICDPCATVTLLLRSDDHIGVVPLAVYMHAVLIAVIMLNV